MEKAYKYRSLSWCITVKCDFPLFWEYVDDYLQWFEISHSDANDFFCLHTNVCIEYYQEYIVLKCRDIRRVTSTNCNFVLAVFAELCNDDFLRQKLNTWCILHGAGISNNGIGADIFLAPTQMGKSTLAYFMCINGMHFCTDDMIIIDTTSNMLIPYPKPIYLRTLDLVNENKLPAKEKCIDYQLRYDNNECKYPVFPEKKLSVPVKIDHIYIYHRSSYFAIRELHDTEAFKKLLVNSYSIKEFKTHCEQLVDIVRKNKILELQCHRINALLGLVREGLSVDN